ncbi:hypothetical protein ACWDTT_33230 [Streptosporangium sandarakinum]
MRRHRVSPRQDRVRETAARRLATVGATEALDWLDSSLSGAWKAAEDYRKTGEIFSLEETERGLLMALGAVDDQKRRRGLA